jgi:hypothetical protein
MLREGKVSVDEAERLLNALNEPATSASGDGPGRRPRYLRVAVDEGKQKVNVRVPMALLRAGVKFMTLIPEQHRGQIDKKLGEKGIDLDQLNFAKMKPEDLEELIRSLSELTVDVQEDGKQTIRVFCE